MEQLNRIELRGNVGNINLRTIDNKKVARISLATNYAYKDKEGTAVIETSWHNITAWSGRNIQDLDAIQVGSILHVSGRMRYQKYSSADGETKEIPEVLASHLSIIKDEDTLSCEMN